MKYTKDNLIAVAAEALAGQVPEPNEISEALRDCLDVTPRTSVMNLRDPRPGSPLIGFIVLKPESDSGKSVKPGNIRLNLKKIVFSTPHLAFTGVEVFDNRWLALFGAILLYERVRSIVTTELSKDRAITLGALWSVDPLRYSYSEEEAREIVNEFRSKRSLEKLEVEKFGKIVEGLDSMECIELSLGNIKLVEKVHWAIEDEGE